MNDKVNGDLHINGSGSSSGGIFGTVKVNGTGKVNGDVECKEFKINGSGCVDGNIKTSDGVISGSVDIEGSVRAEKFVIRGSGTIKGDFSGGELRISGSARLDGKADAQNLRIEGSAKIGGDCNAENFRSDGSFSIGGMLNADTVDIYLYHTESSAKEIGGEKITVKSGSSAGMRMLKTILSLGIFNPVLEAGTIEGDEIYLENTNAKVVRGNNITIGDNCKIDLVEYKGQFKKMGNSIISEEKKI